jgi:hypothetical protein
MSSKNFERTTYLYTDPYLMFKEIRQYAEETKDSIKMNGVISEWITVSGDRQWLYRPDHNTPPRDIKEILKGMNSEEKDRILQLARMIVSNDVNLLTQYLNYGDRILKLLSFA